MHAPRRCAVLCARRQGKEAVPQTRASTPRPVDLASETYRAAAWLRRACRHLEILQLFLFWILLQLSPAACTKTLSPQLYCCTLSLFTVVDIIVLIILGARRLSLSSQTPRPSYPTCKAQAAQISVTTTSYRATPTTPQPPSTRDTRPPRSAPPILQPTQT